MEKRTLVIIGAAVVVASLARLTASEPTRTPSAANSEAAQQLDPVKIKSGALRAKALASCQDAIQKRGGAGVERPPFTKDWGDEKEFYFAWESGKFARVDKSGMRWSMSASCIGDMATGRITSLTVNGKDVL